MASMNEEGNKGEGKKGKEEGKVKVPSNSFFSRHLRQKE